MQGDAFQTFGNPLDRLRVVGQVLQVALAGVGVIDHGGQRLIDLVGNPRGQLPQGDQSRRVCHFILMLTLLGLNHVCQSAPVLLGLNARRDVP